MNEHLFTEELFPEVNPGFRSRAILSGLPSCSIFDRLVARGIDTLIMVVVYMLIRNFSHWGAALIAALYAAIADAVGDGRSIGKKIMGLRVIEDNSGMGCGFRAGLQRSFPFVLAALSGAYQILWPIFFVVALPAIGFEIYLLFSIETRTRLGDVLSNSAVIDVFKDERLSNGDPFAG